MKRVHLLKILALCVCSALASASTCDFTFSFSFVTPERADATETQTVAMPAAAQLIVNNENGSTRVTVDPAATQATIEITRIALAASEEEAQALLAAMVVTVTAPTAESNVLRIDAPRPEDSGTTGDIEFSLVDDELSVTGVLRTHSVAIVRLRITLPPSHAVQITNQNGPVRAVGLDTESTLQTDNGQVHAFGGACMLHIENRNGQILVEDHDGALDVTGQNGQVVIDDHSGSIDAQLHNGQLLMDIRALGAGQHIQCQTDNGMVRLELPPNIDAQLSAHTDNGVVVFDEESFDSVTITTQTFTTLAATLNDGGPAIDVQTDNGMVQIEGN